MSELKAFDVGLGRYTEDGYPCVVAFDADRNPRLLGDEKVYLKSEVDKVIADLEESHKMEVEQLLILNREQNDAANRLRDSMKQVIRHSKYKRCMAMHDYCLCELEFSFRDPCIERSTEGYVRWRKWANLWLELAEKFKEAK